jgi:hypothetical protein
MRTMLPNPAGWGSAGRFLLLTLLTLLHLGIISGGSVASPYKSSAISMNLVSTQDRKEDSEYSKDLTPTRDRKENAQNSWLGEIAASAKFWADTCLGKEEAEDQAGAASCWTDAAEAMSKHANGEDIQASHMLAKIIRLRAAWLLRAEQLASRFIKTAAVAGITQASVSEPNPCDVPNLREESCPRIAAQAPEPILVAPPETELRSYNVLTAKVIKTPKKTVTAKAVKVRKKEVAIPKATKARKNVALTVAKVREKDAAITEIAKLQKRQNFSRLHVVRCLGYC